MSIRKDFNDVLVARIGGRWNRLIYSYSFFFEAAEQLRRTSELFSGLIDREKCALSQLTKPP